MAFLRSRVTLIYDQMVYLREYDDALRKFLLREPRGYPPLCCNILVPSRNPKAKAGYIIMEQVEYPLMSAAIRSRLLRCCLRPELFLWSNP